MKTRRHHNTKGLRQIKRGKPAKSAKRLARSLGVPYGEPTPAEMRRVKCRTKNSVFRGALALAQRSPNAELSDSRENNL